MQGSAMMTDTNTQPADRLYSDVRQGSACSAGAPFSQVTIGTRHYEIADVAGTETGAIAFRVAGEPTWTALSRKVADGWERVAAEILLHDPDVLYDFLQTHAVRLQTSAAAPYRLDFDTLGVTWSANLLHDHDGTVCFAGDAPRHVRLGRNASSEGRTRAIMLLLAAYPDARDRFEPHISQWAQRIAQGVCVKPVF